MDTVMQRLRAVWEQVTVSTKSAMRTAEAKLTVEKSEVENNVDAKYEMESATRGDSIWHVTGSILVSRHVWRDFGFTLAFGFCCTVLAYFLFSNPGKANVTYVQRLADVCKVLSSFVIALFVALAFKRYEATRHSLHTLEQCTKNVEILTTTYHEKATSYEEADEDGESAVAPGRKQGTPVGSASIAPPPPQSAKALKGRLGRLALVAYAVFLQELDLSVLPKQDTYERFHVYCETLVEQGWLVEDEAKKLIGNYRAHLCPGDLAWLWILRDMYTLSKMGVLPSRTSPTFVAIITPTVLKARETSQQLLESATPTVPYSYLHLVTVLVYVGNACVMAAGGMTLGSNLGMVVEGLHSRDHTDIARGLQGVAVELLSTGVFPFFQLTFLSLSSLLCNPFGHSELPLNTSRRVAHLQREMISNRIVLEEI